MSYNPRDHYFKKAKAENYAARSVYKLKEIDERYKIFRSGQSILDLGAAPGSWSQYASSKIGAQGKLLSIDLTEITIKIPQMTFVQGDINQLNVKELAAELGVDQFAVVLSDMAPKTTGIKITDQARSKELCDMALQVAIEQLKTGGAFVCKLFHSSDFEEFRKSLRANFNKVEAIKPDSTRSQSKEIFLVGMNKK